MAGMRLADKVLVHQGHPAKVGVDVTAAVGIERLAVAGTAEACAPGARAAALAGSAAVLGLADLDALAATRRGRYVCTHMPASAQAVRLAGDALMGLGAHRRNRLLPIAGAGIIVAAGRLRHGQERPAECGDRGLRRFWSRHESALRAFGPRWSRGWTIAVVS